MKDEFQSAEKDDLCIGSNSIDFWSNSLRTSVYDTHTIQHTLYIKGFGISVNEFIDDTTIGDVLTAIDWGQSWPDVDLYYNIVIQNVETESCTLEFTNNLSATVGIARACYLHSLGSRSPYILRDGTAASH